ncbi:hypothetical protein PVAG01_02198 [Phlyctema vagabunda]|uniref:Uncharacterized protein n=1 Tax=Phlyctema vagabunda TaxID=108571 RepID=A0ABR4PQK3_9HELO
MVTGSVLLTCVANLTRINPSLLDENLAPNLTAGSADPYYKSRRFVHDIGTLAPHQVGSISGKANPYTVRNILNPAATFGFGGHRHSKSIL